MTIFNANGSYSGESIYVLYCIVNRNELLRFKKLTKEIDPAAFISVFSVNEVFGEGFESPD